MNLNQATQTPHQIAQQWFDRYAAIMELRNATSDQALWRKLDHEARKAWQAWLKAEEAATMISNSASYSPEQGGTAS